MRSRIAAATAVFAVAVLGACAPPTQTQSTNTASVTINGNAAKFNIVKCTQVEWYRTIRIGGDLSGVTVAVDERREPVTADSVHIQNLGGFTGMYSQGDGSDAANLSLSNGRFTITGTAHGYKVDKPGEPATATFKITVTC
jgi:ipoprotein LpqH